MSRISKGATFTVGGKLHKGSFGNYDVWERNVTPVVRGVHQEMKTDFLVTRKTKNYNKIHNLVNIEHVDVESFNTLDEALQTAEKMN